MSRQELDDALLLKCISLWKERIGRGGGLRRTIILVIEIVIWVLATFAGLAVAVQLSVGTGALILGLTLLLVAFFDLISAYGLVKQRADWLSNEQEAVVSSYIISLKNEAQLRASDISAVVASAEKKEALIDKKVHDVQSILTSVVAAGLFAAICSCAFDLDTPIKGASLPATIGLAVLIGVEIVVLALYVFEVAVDSFENCTKMSRMDLRSCQEALRLTTLSCFEECWEADSRAGKHMRRD